LVIGTTPDYIDLICRRFPGRALFLTDVRLRAGATEPPPDDATELAWDLTRPVEATSAFLDLLERRHIEPTGVACFDCESMHLAASIAQNLSLPYPSAESVAACRSKLTSKRLWRQAGLPCPEAERVAELPDVLRFVERVKGPVVLKPLTGSGSELTFLCTSQDECAAAFGTLKARMAEHTDVRMYGTSSNDGPDPRHVFAVEELVEGREYSCDFVLDRETVQILRVAEKIPDRSQAFGTTLAYVVPAPLPPEIDTDRLRRKLAEAARSVGLERALCMLDFIVRDREAVMLEMAPRPGGDCLPPLLRQCSGFDVLGAMLDFAEQRPVAVPAASQWRLLVGLRLFSPYAGVIRALDAEFIHADPRVLECELTRGEGHHVVLPPEDYDSRLLGHAIFAPSSRHDIESECVEIADKLVIELEAT